MSTARELADQIITYGLTELTDLLPDGCILETVNDRARGDGLTKTERDQLFDDVYELVGKAGERTAARLPRRGDEVEAWLKAERDRWSEAHDTQWDVIDDLLNDYRLHADTGTPLGEHVCEQHCDCGEALPLGRDVSDGGQDA